MQDPSDSTPAPAPIAEPPPSRAEIEAHDRSASFRIEALRRPYAGAADPWDSNRLEVELRAQAHGVRAELRGPLLLNSELATLAAQLRKLGRGAAVLESPFMEAAIELTVRPQPAAAERFRIELKLGELGQATEADARFAFDVERAQLERFADGLERIVGNFPVRSATD